MACGTLPGLTSPNLLLARLDSQTEKILPLSTPFKGLIIHKHVVKNLVSTVLPRFATINQNIPLQCLLDQSSSALLTKSRPLSHI